MATHAPSQDHHPTLRHADREAIGAELQDILVELIDLSLLGKQAHWNLYGPNFRSLHLQLDELVDEWREASDEVAERAVALGHSPDGLDEFLDVNDAVLEKVAGASGSLVDQLQRVVRLDVLRQDQHANVRLGRGDL